MYPFIEIFKVLLDESTRDTMSQRAKELTMLPLGDLSEEYFLQGFLEGRA